MDSDQTAASATPIQLVAHALQRCQQCPARATSFCSELNDDDLAELAKLKLAVRTLQAGAELYRQGDKPDAYYTVLDGWVALRMVLEDGSRHAVDFAVRGAFLGIVSGGGGELSHTAECLTRVRVCAVPRAKLHGFIAARPRALERMMHITTCHEARAQDHFVNLAGRDARDRLAHLLVELFFRLHHRLPTRRGDSAEIPLTQAQLGEAVGLTAVHVSRMVRALREAGLARYSKGVLTVLDADRLLEAAGMLLPGTDYGRDGMLSPLPEVA